MKSISLTQHDLDRLQFDIQLVEASGGAKVPVPRAVLASLIAAARKQIKGAGA